MSPLIFRRKRVKCPFCRATVVSAYHPIEEVDTPPYKLPRNRVVASSLSELDMAYALCPHVAFFCYWGYTEPLIVEEYRPLLLEIAEKLELNTEILEGELAVQFVDNDEEELEKALKAAYRGIRVRTDNICLSNPSMPQWNLPGIVQVLFLKLPSL